MYCEQVGGWWAYYEYDWGSVKGVCCLEKKRQVGAKYFCWRWSEMERLEVADVVEVVSDGSNVSRWVAYTLFMGMAGAVR